MQARLGQRRGVPITRIKSLRQLLPPVLCALLLTACGSPTTESEPTTLPDAPVTNPETVATTTSTLEESSSPETIARSVVPLVLWEQVGQSEALEHGWMSAVIEGGPGYVAVGVVIDADDRADPGVWVSVDGTTWERVVSDGLVVDANPAETDDEFIADVASGPLGLVAVGSEGIYRGEGGSRNGDYDAAVWVSADGRDWSRVPHAEDVFGGDGIQIIRRVIATETGWVASGESDLSAAIWFSTDGQAWSRIPDEMIDPAGETVAITDLATRGDLIVAIGHTPRFASTGKLGSRTHYLAAPSLEPFTPAAWLSTDGVSWERVPGLETLGETGAVMEAVTVTGEGTFLAVGHTQEGFAVWRSEDGWLWTGVENTVYTNWFPNEPWYPSITEWNGILYVVGDCVHEACAIGSVDGGITWDDTGGTTNYLDGAESVSSMYWHSNTNDVISTDSALMVVGMIGAGAADDGRFDAVVFLGR